MPNVLESSRGPAPIFWGIALAASMLAHVGLFRLNPSLQTGAGGSEPASASRFRPELKALPPRPETLREALPRLLERVEVKADLPDPTLPDLPADLRLDPAEGLTDLPEVEASAPPAPLAESALDPAPASEWSPREEVLAITAPKIEETLEVLPRAFREVETTRPGAPDVTLPSDRPELPFAEPEREQDAFSQMSFPGPGGGGAPWMEGGSGGMATPPMTPLTPPPLPEMEEEPVPGETPLIATEDLLRLSVRVYDPPEEPDARYFKLQLMRNGIESLPVMPRDLVYLIDCSASMTAQKLQWALEGVRRSLESAAEPDRIQVIAFRDRVELFSSEPRVATVVGKAQVRTFLSSLQARGQTDVFASLEALTSVPSVPNRPVLAWVITDGVPTQGVTDTGDILNAFSRENEGRISVFGLGGGDRVNRQLLDFLSFRNRGFSFIAGQGQGLQEVIPQLAAQLRRPVLADLEIRFTGSEPPDVYPRSLSHLYVDRPWILIGRTDRSTDRLAFQVVGTSLDGTHDVLFDLNLSEQAKGGTELRQEWAWQAGLEKWAAALLENTPEAFRKANDFFRAYELEVPEAYQN